MVRRLGRRDAWFFLVTSTVVALSIAASLACGGDYGATEEPPSDDGAADAAALVDVATVDDAHDSSADAPQADAAPDADHERVMFVSDSAVDGNLGGIAKADALCTELAAASPVPTIVGRTFRAWMSDGTASPATRLSHGTMPYRRGDGVLVAKDWGDLVDGTLGAAVIAYSEKGGDKTGNPIWTGTAGSGAAAGPNCLDWAASGATARVGTGLAGTLDWSSNVDRNCSSGGYLLCIEE